MALGVAEGLHHLHSRSTQPVIHRDVKSSNILLSDDFEPQVVHLQISKNSPSFYCFALTNDKLLMLDTYIHDTPFCLRSCLTLDSRNGHQAQHRRHFLMLLEPLGLFSYLDKLLQQLLVAQIMN